MSSQAGPTWRGCSPDDLTSCSSAATPSGAHPRAFASAALMPGTLAPMAKSVARTLSAPHFSVALSHPLRSSALWSRGPPLACPQFPPSTANWTQPVVGGRTSC
ncbi:unnamed protein product [Rangifer tarandus platyrhynchus]|uniref:Uncharacterized protein n=1 Tax=Rangifer tarandus platyrhynchus TaxID=3082113 RepID=A0AC59ZWR2_RANTA